MQDPIPDIVMELEDKVRDKRDTWSASIMKIHIDLHQDSATTQPVKTTPHH